jgi:uncharacterized membrane protein
MTTGKFSMGEAIDFGWNTTKSNLIFFIGLMIVVGLILFIPGFISRLVKPNAPDLSYIINIASLVFQAIIQMGLIKIALIFCDKDKAEFSDLFSCFSLLSKYLFSSLLYGLIVTIGTVLLIIPGVVWAIKFQFFSYLVIDKGSGPIEAFKKSSVITDGAKWDLFVFGLLLGTINLLGALAFLIGLFITIPTTILALAFVFRKLLSQIEHAQTEITQINGAPINP